MKINLKINSETVDKVYNDGLKETVKESSKVVSPIPRATRTVFNKVEKYILECEYNIEETNQLLS